MEPFGLVIVKVKVLVPFIDMVVGENALLMLRGAITVKVADAAFPVPPLVEVTAEVVLTLLPPLVPVTVTLTVQVMPASMVPPEKVRLVAPALGANTGDPHPDVSASGVAATCIPAGKLSVKPTPVNATVFEEGLVMVKTRTLVPFTLIEEGVNPLEITGFETEVICA